jgi:hypothetical protein
MSVSSKNLVRFGFVLAFSFLALGVAGCGGNKHKVLTPEERLEQQLAIENENQAKPSQGTYAESEADSEEAAKFDPEFADHQLRLSTLNAKDCPNSLPDDEKKKFKPGTANMRIVFQPEGTVKELVMDPAYVDTAVGACLARAYENIQIKPYTGEDQTLDWKVELKIVTEAEKKKAKEKAAKEAEAKDKKE